MAEAIDGRLGCTVVQSHQGVLLKKELLDGLMDELHNTIVVRACDLDETLAQNLDFSFHDIAITITGAITWKIPSTFTIF